MTDETTPQDGNEMSPASVGSVAEDALICSVRHHRIKDDDYFSSNRFNGQHWWIPSGFRYVSTDTPRQLRTWREWLTGKPKSWEVTFRFECVGPRQ